MLAYAHQGAHQAAIQAAYKQNYFSESMFVRMRVLEQAGSWPSPLAQAAAQASSTDDGDDPPRDPPPPMGTPP
jgi:spheroidene monooxygenase